MTKTEALYKKLEGTHFTFVSPSNINTPGYLSGESCKRILRLCEEHGLMFVDNEARRKLTHALWYGHIAPLEVE